MHMHALTVTGTLRVVDLRALLAAVPANRMFPRAARVGPITLAAGDSVAAAEAYLSDLTDAEPVEVDLRIDLPDTAEPTDADTCTALGAAVGAIAMAVGIGGDATLAGVFLNLFASLADVLTAQTESDLSRRTVLARMHVSTLAAMTLARLDAARQLRGRGSLALVPDGGEDAERFPVVAEPPAPREGLGFAGRMPAPPPDEPPHMCASMGEGCKLSARECWQRWEDARILGDRLAEQPARD